MGVRGKWLLAADGPVPEVVGEEEGGEGGLGFEEVVVRVEDVESLWVGSWWELGGGGWEGGGVGGVEEAIVD